MNPSTIMRVQESFRAVEPIAETAAELFYGRLFAIDPTAAALFGKSDMKLQGHKLMSALAMVVANLNKPDRLVPAAQDMARRHVAYGVQPRHYETVGAALLWTLEQGLGEAWTPELKAAWTEAYTTLSGVMIAAAEPAA